MLVLKRNSGQWVEVTHEASGETLRIGVKLQGDDDDGRGRGPGPGHRPQTCWSSTTTRGTPNQRRSWRISAAGP